MLEKTIIAATGMGYLMVGVLQLRKGAFFLTQLFG